MNIIVIADGHYEYCKNGKVYVNAVYDHSYWERYLNTFERITVVARGKHVEMNTFSLMSSCDNVDFCLTRDFRGIKGLIKSLSSVKQTLKNSIDNCDGAIVRIPSPLSRMAINYLSKINKPFLCEMAADPEENYDNVPFSKVIKLLMKKSLLNGKWGSICH